jgi:hypothetical protein
MEAWKLKTEPGRFIDQRSLMPITLRMSKIRIRILVKSWIRIRIKVESRLRIRIKVESRLRIRIKHEISYIFQFFVGNFFSPGSGSGSTDLIESGYKPDPDPKHCINYNFLFFTLFQRSCLEVVAFRGPSRRSARLAGRKKFYIFFVTISDRTMVFNKKGLSFTLVTISSNIKLISNIVLPIT